MSAVVRLNSDTLCNAIIGAAVMALIDDGYRVELSDQDGGGLYLYGWPDNGKSGGNGAAHHWVSFTIGNGPADLIRDYTTNLETTLRPVIALAAVLGDDGE